MAPSSDNYRCYQTTDGYTWEPISGTKLQVPKLFYLDGVYFSFSFSTAMSYGLFVSTDLKTWETVTSPGKAILGICSTDNYFYLLLQNSDADASSDGATLYKSQDGKTWTISKHLEYYTNREYAPYYICPNPDYAGIDFLIEARSKWNYAGYIYASYTQDWYELYDVLGKKIPLSLTQIETGSYIGTGSTKEHIITCGFSPQFFIVTALYAAGAVTQTFVAPLPAENVEYAIPYILIDSYGNFSARVDKTKIKRLVNGISFSAVTDAADSFNMSNITYTYTFWG